MRFSCLHQAIAGALLAALAAASPLSAQDAWHSGTALSLFGGAATASADTGPAVGTALAWELTPRFTIEGSGFWADRPDGANAFAALLGPRVNLRPRRTADPFVSAGIGLYRASFRIPADDLPAFYRRRLAGDGRRRRATFTDIAAAVGGGVDIYVHRHLAIRPDVRVLFVAGGSDVRPVALMGIHVAYHFESHNVTP